MASGINKSRQPGTCNGSKAPRGSSAEGYNKEIHMQMCKKIAQLTKVSRFPGGEAALRSGLSRQPRLREGREGQESPPRRCRCVLTSFRAVLPGRCCCPAGGARLTAGCSGELGTGVRRAQCLTAVLCGTTTSSQYQAALRSILNASHPTLRNKRKFVAGGCYLLSYFRATPLSVRKSHFRARLVNPDLHVL